MELREIVAEWLVAHKLDGLCDQDDCACGLDDLMPCGEPHPDCVAGRKVPCTGGDCDGDCDFHIEEVHDGEVDSGR